MRNKLGLLALFLLFGCTLDRAIAADPPVLVGKAAGELRHDAGLKAKLVWCPPGTFKMGSPALESDRSSNGAGVDVTLSGFWLGQTEVTQAQFQRVHGTAPWSGKTAVKGGPDYPASYVDHADALSFCAKLTSQERVAGRLPSDWEYRLPTEAEWEYACRAGTKTAYSFGNDVNQLSTYAWWDANTKVERYAHEVGLKQANAWGLKDMHGNVKEWCGDWYGEELAGGTNPRGPAGGSYRCSRGGDWYISNPRSLRSAYRYGSTTPTDRDFNKGFRLVLVGCTLDRAIAQELLVPKGSFTNTIGMSLKLIPAGTFQMGSSAADIEKAVRLVSDFSKSDADNEQPQHRVQITKAFYLGQHEVTVGQFRKFVIEETYKTEAESDGKGGYGFDEAKGRFEQNAKYTWRNPGFTQTDEHPVVNVSWNDCQKFCAWLSRKDSAPYRLPTEAEWEYAARGGTTTLYPSGDDPESIVKIDNIADGTAKAKYSGWTTISARDGYVTTAPVGRFAPTGFGLYDVTGNAAEWCEDVYNGGAYAARSGVTKDPKMVTGSEKRVLRGVSWFNNDLYARVAHRGCHKPVFRLSTLGFRVVCVSRARTR